MLMIEIASPFRRLSTAVEEKRIENTNRELSLYVLECSNNKTDRATVEAGVSKRESYSLVPAAHSSILELKGYVCCSTDGPQARRMVAPTNCSNERVHGVTRCWQCVLRTVPPPRPPPPRHLSLTVPPTIRKKGGEGLGWSLPPFSTPQTTNIG